MSHSFRYISKDEGSAGLNTPWSALQGIAASIHHGALQEHAGHCGAHAAPLPLGRPPRAGLAEGMGRVSV